MLKYPLDALALSSPCSQVDWSPIVVVEFVYHASCAYELISNQDGFSFVFIEDTKYYVHWCVTFIVLAINISPFSDDFSHKLRFQFENRQM